MSWRRCSDKLDRTMDDAEGAPTVRSIDVDPSRQGTWFISARADTEPVDQKNYLEERCKPLCVKSLYDYERCVKRVENDGSGQKHCTGQYFDYWSCVDKCVAPKLFDKLK
nr:unnamed protein product [Digitaria exilis]